MTGNELYERFQRLMRQHSPLVPGMDPPLWLAIWDHLHAVWKKLWNDLAAEVTTVVASRDPINPVTDDEIMSWIEAQKPNVLARLYQILHSMGYRI